MKSTAIEMMDHVLDTLQKMEKATRVNEQSVLAVVAISNLVVAKAITELTGEIAEQNSYQNARQS